MPPSEAVADAWTSADAYERFIGRWSRQLAPRFLQWAGIAAPERALDVGCGSGALTEALLEADALHVTGVDLAPAYVAACTARYGVTGKAEFRVADAQELPFADATFDAAASGLVLNFVPKPQAAATGMRRVTKPGGTVAAYLWDYRAGMEALNLFWDAAADVDPEAAALAEIRRFPLCEGGPLRSLWREAGLREVEVGHLEVATTFRDFDDYWTPFLGGQGPAPTYLANLGPEQRDRIRDALRKRLPWSGDGAVQLTARAVAVRGTVPG